MVKKEKKKVNMTLSTDIYEQVIKLAEIEKRTISGEVEYILSLYLNKHKPLRQEEIDFSDIQSRELLLTSESSLKKFWNTAEEDKAWENL